MTRRVDLDTLAPLPPLTDPAEVEVGDVVRIAWSLEVGQDFTAEAWALPPIVEVGPTATASPAGPWIVSAIWDEVLDLEELKEVPGFPARALLHVPRWAVQPLSADANGSRWRARGILYRRQGHRQNAARKRGMAYRSPRR